MERNQKLIEFTAIGLARIEPDVACKLLGQRRRALGVPSFLQINQYRFDDSNGIESGMLEKALVFDGDYSVNQYGRDIVVFHEAPLLTVLVEEAA